MPSGNLVTRNISGIAGTGDSGLAASSAKYARILFTPSLAEAEERSAYDGEEASHTLKFVVFNFFCRVTHHVVP